MVTPILSPPYSPRLYEYEDRLLVLLQNLTQQTQEVKLAARLEGDNGYYAFTKSSFQPASPIVLQPMEVRTIVANAEGKGFLDLDNIETNASATLKRAVVQTGILPEGNYTFCVQALDYLSGAPLSGAAPIGCIPLQISYLQPPVLVQPVCESAVQSPLPVFSWTPPVGNVAGGMLRYDLYILKLLPGQNPNDAMHNAFNYRAGNPYIVENIPINTYVYLPADPPLEDGQTYAVMVVARDLNESLVFENDGRSEVCTFVFQGISVGTEGETGPTTGVGQLPDDDFEPLKNTRVKGRLLYTFPGASLGRLSGNQAQQAVPLSGIGYAQLIKSGASGNSAAYSYEPNYLLGGYGVANVQGSQDEQKKKQLSQNFSPSSSGARPLAGVPVRLVMQLVVNVSYYWDGKNEKQVQPDNPRAVIKYPGLFTRPGTGEALPLMSIGSTLATAVTDAQGNFEFFFKQEDSTGYIIDDLFYVSSQSQIEYQQCQLLCPNTVPNNQNPFDPGPLINPSDKGLMFQSGGGIGFTPSFNLPKPGGNSLPAVDERLLRAIYEQVLADCDCYMDGIRIDFGMPVLRVVVDDAYYCSPDNDIIVQPGQEVDLGTLISYVQSYNLQLSVKSDDTRQQAAGQKKPLEEYRATVLRQASAANSPHLPVDEGQNLQKQETIAAGPCKVVADHYANDKDGQTFFTRMVRHKLVSYQVPDPYILLVRTSHDTIGQYKYLDDFSEIPATPSPRPMAIEGIVYNSEYKVETFQKEVILHPEVPAFAGIIRTETSNLGQFPLEGARVRITATLQNGQKQVIQGLTGENGFIWLDALPPEETYSGGVPTIVGPKYTVEISKEGYKKVVYNYTLSPQPGQSGQGSMKQLLQWLKSASNPGAQPMPVPIWGEIKIISTKMEPLGYVWGYVQDEAGKPVKAKIRIGNGAWYETTDTITGYVNSPGPQAGVFVKMPVAKSRFTMQAEEMASTKLYVFPLGSQYLPDTFEVNTTGAKWGQPPKFLGTLTIRERLHRPVIVVNTWGNEPVAGALVRIGNHEAKTNAQGQAAFAFGSPGKTFPLRIEAAGLVTIDTLLENAVSNAPVFYTFHLDAGYSISGTVTAGLSKTPLPGARIFIELGGNGNFGTHLIEAWSGPDGKYELKGVPMGTHLVRCVKASPPEGPAYVGDQKNVSISTLKDPITKAFLPTIADFNLGVMEDGILADIWGFKVEIEKITRVGTEFYLTGALVDLPANENFGPAAANARLPFSKIKIRKSATPSSNGKYRWEPVGDQFASDVLAFDLKLYGAFDARLRSTSGLFGNFAPTLMVRKSGGENGIIEGMVLPQLYSFNITHQFDGTLALADGGNTLTIPVFQGKAPYPYREFNLAGLSFNLSHFVAKDPQFKVFQFKATANRQQSFSKKDGFYLHTYLHTEIEDMNPADLNIELGDIFIGQSEIGIVNMGGSALSFKLEKWSFSSQQKWYFDLNRGGIAIEGGLLKTGWIDVQLQNILIKPDALQASGKNIKTLELGGVANLNVTPGTESFLQYDPYYQHWALLLSNTSKQPVGTVPPLPGFDKPLVIQNVLLLADDSKQEIDLKTGQSFTVHKMFLFTPDAVGALYAGNDYFNLKGKLDLKMPNVQEMGLTFQFSKSAGKTVKHIKQMTVDILNLPGYVDFKSTADPTIADNLFSAEGIIVVKENAAPTARQFSMTGKLTRTNTSATIEVTGNPLVNFGGQKGLRVVQGRMEVDFAKYKWNFLGFDADFEGFTGVQDKVRRNHYVVTGAVHAGDGKVGVNNISTPMGKLALLYDFDKGGLYGNLHAPLVPLGLVNLENVNCMFAADGHGFATYGDGKVILPPPVADFDVTFLAGTYDDIGQFSGLEKTIIGRTYLKKLPESLQDKSLGGVLVIGRKNLYSLHEGFGVDVMGVGATVSVDAEAGAECDFSFDIATANGNPQVLIRLMPYAETAASLDIEITGVGCCCSCGGMKGFMAAQALYDGNFNLDLCGGMNMAFSVCGLGFDKTIYASGSLSSSGGLDVGLGFSGCTGQLGNVLKVGSACE